MDNYRNLAGNSGVTSYEILGDAIKVQFSNGTTYLYDYRNPGRDHVEKMKQLAKKGQGLATYIVRMGGDYAERVK
jgi:hypothetical protein